MECLVDLDTAVRACSSCPKLYITMAIVINPTAWFDPRISHTQSCMLSLDRCHLHTTHRCLTWETCAFRCRWSDSGSTSTTERRWRARAESAASAAGARSSAVDRRSATASARRVAVTDRHTAATSAGRPLHRPPTVKLDDSRLALTTP